MGVTGLADAPATADESPLDMVGASDPEAAAPPEMVDPAVGPGF